VRIVVGFAAGGPADILARLVGRWLSERLGQPFVVENRMGAGSNIAAESVAHSPADGYTLLLVANPQAINASLYNKKLSFNFVVDVTPVAGIAREPFAMLVPSSSSARTVPEFIGYAAANKGKLNMASAGNGTASHVSGELFKMMAGVDLLHVPYRGAAPALTDLIGGRVEVAFLPTAGTIEHVRSGRLRALAVTTSTRSEVLPDVPTVADFLPGYESSAWFGIGAPRGTSADIIDTLNREITAGLADPRMKARLADSGGTAITGSPADFGKLVADETEKWRKVVELAGIKPE
jgi:tripartite-type tricarboxylate transporter receptor subunit TctC